jgi:hypothetical protein
MFMIPTVATQFARSIPKQRKWIYSYSASSPVSDESTPTKPAIAALCQSLNLGHEKAPHCCGAVILKIILTLLKC